MVMTFSDACSEVSLSDNPESERSETDSGTQNIPNLSTNLVTSVLETSFNEDSLPNSANGVLWRSESATLFIMSITARVIVPQTAVEENFVLVEATFRINLSVVDNFNVDSERRN